MPGELGPNAPYPPLCLRWRRSLSALVLEGDVARRMSLHPLDGDEGVGVYQGSLMLAVSDARIFHTTETLNLEQVTGGAELWMPSYGPTAALGYSPAGQLSLLGEVSVGAPLFTVARGDRAFVSGAPMTVITSPNGATPTSKAYEGVSGFESFADHAGQERSTLDVVGNQVFIARGRLGVQRVVLE